MVWRTHSASDTQGRGREPASGHRWSSAYTPPDPTEIVALMTDLERFINGDRLYAADPLVKMALIHHQFESIHPFSDGNGRTGRILCVLYLVKQGLLDIPVLNLSRRIVRTKTEYYRLLQTVREHDTWEDWVCYMLDAVEGTARQGLATFLKNDLGVTRLTATRYLDALVADGILEKRRIGWSNYYINTALYAILTGEGMTDNGV